MASSDAIKAGEGNIVLGMDLGPLANDLKSVQAKLQAWGQGVMAAGAGIGAIGAAIVAPFLSGLSVFGDMGSDIFKTARMTGLSFSEVQMAMYGTKLSAEELQVAMKKMNSFIASAAHGSPEATAELRRMGLSVKDLANLTEYERLLLFAEGLQTIGDFAEQSTAQVKIFGRSGLEMNVTGGRAGVSKRAARGIEIGGIFSDQDVLLAKEYSVSQKELAMATAGFWAQVGAAAAPLMKEFNSIMTQIIITARQWVQENRPLLALIFTIGFGFAKLGLSIGFLSPIVVVVTGALKLLIFTLTTLLPIALVVGLVIAGLAIVFYTLSYLIETFPSVYGPIFEALGNYFSAWIPMLENFGKTFMQVWGGIGDAIGGGDLALAMEIAVLGVQLVWERMINYLKQSWTDFNYVLKSEFNTSLAEIARLIGAYAVGGGGAAGSTLAGIVNRQPGQTEDELTIAADKQRKEAAEREKELQKKLDDAAWWADFYNQIRIANMGSITSAPGVPGSDLMGHGTSSVGTFSASAIAGMIGGTDPIDKLRVVAEQQLDVQKDQLRAIENAFEWA